MVMSNYEVHLSEATHCIHQRTVLSVISKSLMISDKDLSYFLLLSSSGSAVNYNLTYCSLSGSTEFEGGTSEEYGTFEGDMEEKDIYCTD